MKIKIMFKDPDGVFESIRDYVSDIMDNRANPAPVDELVDLDEQEQEMHRKVEDKLRRWIWCGEYLTVEFDTDAGTATVVPRS